MERWEYPSFFFHLSRNTKNQINDDYAGDLIDEIYAEITANIAHCCSFLQPRDAIARERGY
jgi:hypothetical protein